MSVYTTDGGMFDDVNWLAVLVGTIAYMIIGFVWYTGFSSLWMDAMGMTGDEMAGDSPTIGYLITTLGSFVAVVSLALLVGWVDASTWQDGAVLGAIVGIGFVATTAVQAVPFEGRAWSLYAINTGYNVVALVGIAILLVVW